MIAATAHGKRSPTLGNPRQLTAAVSAAMYSFIKDIDALRAESERIEVMAEQLGDALGNDANSAAPPVQTAIHAAAEQVADAPPAVIFNKAAGLPVLLNYAHAQLIILDELLVWGDQHEGDTALARALRGVLDPAMTAVLISIDLALEGAAA